jgi:hypothetical protein
MPVTPSPPPQALNRLGWLLAVILALFVVASFAGVVRGGPLDPTSVPAPTLPQVEPRIPIRQPASPAAFPIVISASGSYFLTQNITAGAASNGINITASNVTLDLNGFTLSGADAGADGISINGGSNVAISNGTVRDWTNVGVRDVTGSGGMRYERLTVISNNGGGIAAGANSTIKDCIATGNGGNGVAISQASGAAGSSLISGCVVDGSVLDGIQVEYNATVTGNTVSNSGVNGIHALQSGNVIDGNHLDGNAGKGIWIDLGSNVIIRNSFSGGASELQIAAGNAKGPTETGGTPISNPWANISY